MFKIIQANPMFFFGLVAGIAVLATRRRQRIGDTLAKTYVFKRANVRKITPPDKLVET